MESSENEESSHETSSRAFAAFQRLREYPIVLLLGVFLFLGGASIPGLIFEKPPLSANGFILLFSGALCFAMALAKSVRKRIAVFVLGLLIIAPYILIPNLLEAQMRSSLSIVLQDLRSVQVALESYRIDYGTYPVEENWAVHLTTPVAYCVTIPVDWFSSNSGVQRWFGYQKLEAMEDEGDRFVIFSVGPDQKRDLPTLSIQSIYSSELNIYAYDPTNGTMSDGDIVNVSKQSVPPAFEDIPVRY